MIAKLIAAAGVGLVFGAAGFAASTAVAMVFVAAKGYDVALSAGTIVGYGAGAILAAGLLAAVGFGFGCQASSTATPLPFIAALVAAVAALIATIATRTTLRRDIA